MKAIFTSDPHGNMDQYKALFRNAEETGIRNIIIGGDLCPHGNIQQQKAFLQHHLIPLLEKQKNNILMMLGNDDWASCMEVLRPYDGQIFQLMHNRKIQVEDIMVIGYANVPITPFGLKDWEKWDIDQMMERIRLQGVKSMGDEMVEFMFDPQNRTPTLKADLEMLAPDDPEKSVCVIHGPPLDTNLDTLKNSDCAHSVTLVRSKQSEFLACPRNTPRASARGFLSIVGSGLHVGSKAVREFIEEHQPLLTLHGHIHETVDLSGHFTDSIGKTICASAGNHSHTSKLAVILFATDNLKDIKREMA